MASSGSASRAENTGSTQSNESITKTTTTTTKNNLINSTPATWSYFFILCLFRFVMRVFYSNVVVEGAEFIPEDGVPCILTSNHSNSLTDALLLVTTVPRHKRKLLRLTAKDTQFGKGTFTSWLIEAAGTVPIQRPKDHLGKQVDNSVVFAQLIESLERGDMVCMFPEGLSRYYPRLAELKQGVARIVSDVLSRQQENKDFKLAIQTCSITYLHRNLFRSSVLVTFHPPLIVSPSTHPTLIAPTPLTTSTLPSTSSSPPTPTASQFSYDAVRLLTSQMGEQIRSGTLDSPSWEYIRAGNTARRLYAPLGTRLGLGDHVRLTGRFVDVFANRKRADFDEVVLEGVDPKVLLKMPLVDRGGREGEGKTEESEIVKLVEDLKTYQDLLYLHGIKDDRIRNPRMLRRRTLYKRLLVRLTGSLFLFLISIPGLILWSPVFYIAHTQSEKQKRTGPVFDTYDEVAQTKLAYGLISGIITLLVCYILTFPLLPFTLPLFPILMWLTLRWIEDLTSSLRASLALVKLLLMGKREFKLLKEMREGLEERVKNVAVKDAGLPRDSSRYLEIERKGGWRGMSAGFFSLRRRRKKDWNEVLRLYDETEFPENDLPPPIEKEKEQEKKKAE